MRYFLLRQRRRLRGATYGIGSAVGQGMTQNMIATDDQANDERLQGRFLDHLTHEVFVVLNDYRAVLASCRTKDEAQAISERLDLLAKLVSQAQDDAADLVNQLEG